MRIPPLCCRAAIVAICLFLLSSCSSNRKLHVWEYGTIHHRSFNEVVTFEEEAGLIFIEVELGGQVRKFLFDTGAPNVLSRELMITLGLTPAFFSQVQDSNNRRRKLPVVRLDSLRIGDLLFTDTHAVVADLKDIHLFDCLGIDGFIGANLMRLAKWQIDFSTRRITISDQMDRLPIARAVPVSFSTNGQGTPYLKLKIDGTPVKVKLDYGSTGGFSLRHQQRSDLIHGHIVNRSFGLSSIGLYGEMEDTVRHYRFRQVQLGNLSFPGQVVKFESNGSPLIGMHILRHFVTTIDWSNHTLYLQPLRDLPVSFYDYGLIITPKNGKMRVARVVENSPAFRAGLLPGDEVLSLDGLPASEWLRGGGCALYHFFLDPGSLPQTLHLEFLRNGQLRPASLLQTDLYLIGQ